MTAWRRRQAALAALVIALTVGGCATVHDAAALEESRDEVDAAARADLPALADALGAEIEDPWGRWSAGGAKNAFQVSYEATARLVAPSADQDEVAAAIAHLGYEVIQNSDAGVVGTRDDLKMMTAGGDSPFRIKVVGPYLRTETGVVSTGVRDELDLPVD
ncbi:hypothetical protein [Actinotalea sp. C106]|uniref:hypothetical protein n=1 Tax=Actinotalea sp. C106 TaxID=2908644 RepID=UPI002027B6AB|nr:hypothetical protein [Actinotalea sp. C106]